MNFSSDSTVPTVRRHLGSGTWITYTDSSAIQHLHYLPFGEEQIDQCLPYFNSRYTFSAKEKDVETNYSYFGARYYDSDLSIWLSVDPMSDDYPSTSPYAYCRNNPIILVDPDGRSDGWIDDGNGTVFWDQNTNSPEEFAQNYEGKSDYSYVSDTDNPNAYTLPNGDGKLVVNSWKESSVSDGCSGPKISLEFIPSDNSSDCGWIQTYSSNIPDASSGDYSEKLPGANMEDRIDFQTMDENNANVPYWNTEKNSRVFTDMPMRQYKNGATTSVIWNAQSSVINNGNISVTVGWGFTIDSQNSGSYSSPRIINPSPFHKNAINSFK